MKLINRISGIPRIRGGGGGSLSTHVDVARSSAGGLYRLGSTLKQGRVTERPG